MGNITAKKSNHISHLLHFLTINTTSIFWMNTAISLFIKHLRIFRGLLCSVDNNDITEFIEPTWNIFNNIFHATTLFLYPLKTSENQRFSDVFRGIERDKWHETGQIYTWLILAYCNHEKYWKVNFKLKNHNNSVNFQYYRGKKYSIQNLFFRFLCGTSNNNTNAVKVFIKIFC